MTTRRIDGYGDMVVSPHHLATTAGIEILAAGGSAVDAAIAVDAVLGVVAPETCGIGGDLFALVWEPESSSPACLNASGPAGSNADASELRDHGHESMPDFHPASVTIPGCVAGWTELITRFGRLSLESAIRPAVEIARSGFAVSTELAMALERSSDVLLTQSSASDLYPGGTPPRAGDRLTRLGLATTLEGIAADGRRAFYEGDVAMAVSAAVGGRITPEDLGAFRPEWVEPARLDVFGATGWTIPPNSQGYLTLATLRILEHLKVNDPDDPRWTHALVEAYRSMAWERDDLISDPDTAPLTWRQLLAEDRLERRAEQIRLDRVTAFPVPREVPGGTAYMCVVDRSGMAVSLIQSNFMGIGSRIGAGDTGFLLHNRGAGFDLRPGHPNELVPGRRPLHTLSPTLWTKNDALLAVLGTRGGHQQPQILSQMAARLFGAGRPVDGAQDAARWTLDDFGPGSKPVVKVESEYPVDAIDHLSAAGHRVERRRSREGGWGPVSVITVDPGGLRHAAADPRVDTTLAASRH